MASVLNEFRTALNSYFTSGTHYFREAPESATYPYRVSSFNGSFDDEISEVFALEMDYWTSGKSDSALYAWIDTDSGNGNPSNPTGLNKKKFHCSSGTVIMERDSIVSVDDPDKNIRHIRVSYTARVYRKEL